MLPSSSSVSYYPEMGLLFFSFLFYKRFQESLGSTRNLSSADGLESIYCRLDRISGYIQAVLKA